VGHRYGVRYIALARVTSQTTVLVISGYIQRMEKLGVKASVSPVPDEVVLRADVACEEMLRKGRGSI
jgi:hypothetical protein